MDGASKEHPTTYRALDRDSLDLRDQRISAFLRRAVQEGYRLGAEGFLQHPGFFQAPHRRDLTDVDIAIMGVPLDLGSLPRVGARHGPEAARKWSHLYGLVHPETGIIPFEMCSIIDYGDVLWSGYSLAERIQDIQRTYSELAEHDVVPLSVGGEHTISYPILAAIAGTGPVGLVHVDAHCDTMGAWGGELANDTSVFRRATLEGAIDPERTIQIGIRGPWSFLWDFSRESGMCVITADEVFERGVPAIVAKVRDVVGASPAYLSIDTDGLDSACLPGTTLPEPFGLTGRQVRDLVRGLRGLDIIGADITELCPPHDVGEMSANLVAALLFEMLCVLVEARVARTGRMRKTHWLGNQCRTGDDQGEAQCQR